MELLYYTWEIFTMDERNAWWLMMVVFSVTCITFIYTNVKIRVNMAKLEKKQNVILGALYILGENNLDLQEFLEAQEDE
jgi:hypothetical protein